MLSVQKVAVALNMNDAPEHFALILVTTTTSLCNRQQSSLVFSQNDCMFAACKLWQSAGNR